MKKIKRILLAITLGAAVLFTGCGKQDSPANGNGNNIFGNNNTGNNNNGNNNGDNNNGGNNNNGNNLGNTGNSNGGFSSDFTVSGVPMNMVSAVQASESGATAILFEGTNDYGDAVIIVAMTTESFNNSTTYTQNNYGNTIEVLVVAVNTNGGDYSLGSSATDGVTGSQIAIGGDGSASVSGTLISDYGNMPFSAQGAITGVSMDNIRDKINAYNQAISSANGNAGGNGGGNGGTPMTCPSCKGSLKCRHCYGDGTCHICVEGMDHCLSCGGSRVCQYCHGYKTCSWCNGTGVYTP